MKQYIPPLYLLRDKGIWEKLLEVLIDDADYELMIDASHCSIQGDRCLFPGKL